MGGEVNNTLWTVRFRGWIDHHRMDTGMRETLDVSMRKLINDVSISNWYFHLAYDQTAAHGRGSKGLDQTMLAKWLWPKVTVNGM